MSLRTGFIISLIVTLAGAVLVVSGSTYRMPGDQSGYQPVQPIAYSHKVHAGDNKIPCLYCHSAAERGPMAGVPAASTCMNCHRQIRKDRPEIKKIAAALKEGRPIRWTRVHRLPDHVAFDHSRHVNTGVACQQCHGPIETMDRVAQFSSLTMGFCINCHRTENGRRFVDTLTGTRIVRATSTDCSICHH
jgi:hypothetical protein